MDDLKLDDLKLVYQWEKLEEYRKTLFKRRGLVGCQGGGWLIGRRGLVHRLRWRMVERPCRESFILTWPPPCWSHGQSHHNQLTTLGAKEKRLSSLANGNSRYRSLFIHFHLFSHEDTKGN